MLTATAPAANRESLRGSRLSRATRRFVLIAALVAGVLVTVPQQPLAAEAATGSGFNPGNIISDANFYNSASMSVAQIQGFLNGQVRTCAAGYTCLKSYVESTYARPADGMCGAYAAVANQSSADIIYSVAQACRVNPAVLLVVLQKEQGLVTDTDPTAAKYNRATGYACPDTAPCDTQFFGFYNQVYKAAWQYQRYRVAPGNFNYRAGRNNTIRWHPNAACGSSTVFIENQATAGLYNYTPYQPNQAALNNLYGTGDGCSSYGNRNFWRIYSDWFGNPRGGGWFARTADVDTVYLLTATEKYIVPNLDTLNVYYPTLGPVRIVTDDYLAGFTTSPNQLGTLIRDSTTLDVYYFDAGVRHHVDSCELLVEWGTACGAQVDMVPSQLQLLPLGAPLSQFAVAEGTDFVYYVNDGTRRWISSMAEVFALTGGPVPNFSVMSSRVAQTIPTAPSVIPAGTLLRGTSLTPSYLRDGTGGTVTVPTSALTQEFGLPAAMKVPQHVLDQYTLAGSPLSLAVSCGSSKFVAGTGMLWPVADLTGSGLPVTSLDPTTCGGLPHSTTAIGSALFVRSPASGEIYFVTAGQKRFVTSMAALYALNGGILPAWVSMSPASLATIPTGPASLGPLQLVKSSSSPNVFFVDGLAKKIPLSSFAVSTEFGIVSASYTTQSDATLNAYVTASQPLSLLVSCASALYVAGTGQLWPLTVGTGSGLPVTALDPVTCAALPKSPTPITGSALFFRSSSSGEIYYIAGGSKSFVTSMPVLLSLNGGTMPTWVPMSSAALATIPTGAPALGPTQLVKTSASPTVFMIDGPAKKLRVVSFAITTEFGIPNSSTQTQSQTTVDSYATVATPLSLAVSCGTDIYVAGGGSLWRRPSGTVGGLDLTALDSSTCAVLAKSPTAIDGAALFLRSPSSGEIYYISGGKKSFVTSMASLLALNGGTMPSWVPVSSAAIATIPNQGPTS